MSKTDRRERKSLLNLTDIYAEKNASCGTLIFTALCVYYVDKDRKLNTIKKCYEGNMKPMKRPRT